jgi:diguanylate cyclase (GGDEF)-like protein
LTGIYNRRHFSELSQREIYQAKRHQQDLILILLDVDHFKSVNDVYGHATGDEILQWVADCCLNELRIADVVWRHGGDEFVILLPQCELSGGRRVAERLRTKIAQKKLDGPNGLLTITTSMGIATLILDESDTLEALLHRADQALYSAKRKGRNQVVVG